MSKLKAVWVDGQREPQCEPDPRYPDGIDIDASVPGLRYCEMPLQHPARRCGHWLITCETCKLKVALTTAGRPDDPRSVRVSCVQRPH